MKLFLIALSLYNIIHACYAGCGQLPPGMDKMSHGIDLVMFEMFPEDVTTEAGFAGTIFDFTCDQKKVWVNPANTALKYDLPDQVDSLVPLPGGILDHKAIVATSYHERSKMTENHIEISGTFANFTPSLSVTAKKHMQTMIAGDRTLLRVIGHVSAYQVELKPYYLEKMGASIKSFFDTQLPNNYAENPAKYQEFISLFGTHYFTKANFGGVMSLEMDTSKDYSEKHTEKELELKAGLSYKGTFSFDANGHRNTSTNVTDKEFSDASNIKSYYFGGNADLVNTGIDGFKKWWDSAQADPWLFGGKLEQISSFLPAGLKKNAVQTAINVKLDWAALDEMTTGLGYLKQNPHIDMATANSYIAQVQAERVKPIPPHDRVMQLKGAIENFINVERTKKGPVKPVCQVVYDKKQKKNVCVNPTTCICNVH
jgi:hypothetical protein